MAYSKIGQKGKIIPLLNMIVSVNSHCFPCWSIVDRSGVHYLENKSGQLLPYPHPAQERGNIPHSS